MVNKITLLLVIGGACLYSCTTNTNSVVCERIAVPLDKIEPVNITNDLCDNIVVLENSKDAFMSSIIYVDAADGILLVSSGDKILTFDKSGRYIRQIGDQGNASNEYVSFGDVFVRDGRVNIFDNSRKRLLQFSLTGEYIQGREFDTKDPVADVFPTDQGQYVCKPTFQGGGSRHIPEFELYGSNFKRLRKSGNILAPGIKPRVELFQYAPDSLYYWKILRDTIFSVDMEMNVGPRYFIDFGKFSIPRSVRNDHPDIIDLITYLNANGSSYASVIQHVVEKDDTIAFTFAFDGKCLVAVIDKKDKSKCRVLDITLTERNLSIEPYLGVCNDEFVLVGIDNDNMNENYTLVFLKSLNL